MLFRQIPRDHGITFSRIPSCWDIVEPCTTHTQNPVPSPTWIQQPGFFPKPQTATPDHFLFLWSRRSALVKIQPIERPQRLFCSAVKGQTHTLDNTGFCLYLPTYLRASEIIGSLCSFPPNRPLTTSWFTANTEARSAVLKYKDPVWLYFLFFFLSLAWVKNFPPFCFFTLPTWLANVNTLKVL